jgi:class 3 adenylate cyclase
MLADATADESSNAHIRAYRGVLRTHSADRLLATFDAPGQAIRCALALRNQAPTHDPSVRIGIHTGEIDLAGSQIKGPSLSIAERVAGHAQPGEILVSRTVKDLVVGSRITFTARGTHPLTATSELLGNLQRRQRLTATPRPRPGRARSLDPQLRRSFDAKAASRGPGGPWTPPIRGPARRRAE